MSEVMEGNDSAPINTISTSQGCYFQDDYSINSFHGYNGYSADGEHYGKGPRWHEYGDQSNDVMGFVRCVDGDTHVVQSYHLPDSHYDQKPMHQPDEHLRYELQITGNYDYYHPLASTYSVTNAAYPITAPYSQDAQYWDRGLFAEPSTDRLDSVNITTAFSPEKTTGAIETTVDGLHKSQPYAKLIYLALLSAPDHRMILKDIYKWFKQHTDKAQTGSTGWQNSIRHNLSMNIAFQKEEANDPTNQGKRNYVWALSKDALDKGCVESTTRFRKPLNRKTSQTQQSYRISKPSSVSNSKTSLRSVRELPVRTALWNGEILKAKHGLESEELQSSYSQRTAWQDQTAADCLRSAMPAQSDQLTARQSLQQAGYEIVPDSWYHNIVAQNAVPSYPSESTMAYAEKIKYQAARAASPVELAVAERISPCPSMTVTDSSYEYHDLAEEKHYHSIRSSDLQNDTKYSAEQAYDRLRLGGYFFG